MGEPGVGGAKGGGGELDSGFKSEQNGENFYGGGGDTTHNSSIFSIKL